MSIHVRSSIYFILKHLAYRVNGKKVIYQTIIHSFESARKKCVMSVMALDGIMSFLRLKDVTNISKRV